MLSNQKLQNTLYEIREASGLETALYGAKAKPVASDGIDLTEELEHRVEQFIRSAEESDDSKPERLCLRTVECGYSSHEAFTRAFKNVWNCNPSEFRERGTRFTELFPRLREPIQEGDEYMMQRKNVDISQLYDLFQKRRECYFVCCDIKSLVPINEISRKAGDLAIIEAMRRMDAAAGEEDVVFRIGGDEFCILTDSSDPAYAQQIADEISSHNGECFSYCGKEGPARSGGGCLIASGKEGMQIPLALYTTLARFEGESLKYSELFTGMHKALEAAK